MGIVLSVILESFQPSAYTSSSRRRVQGHRNLSHTASDCCQGWPSVTTAARETRKAIQKFHRGDGIYCRP